MNQASEAIDNPSDDGAKPGGNGTADQSSSAQTTPGKTATPTPPESLEPVNQAPEVIDNPSHNLVPATTDSEPMVESPHPECNKETVTSTSNEETAHRRPFWKVNLFNCGIL